MGTVSAPSIPDDVIQASTDAFLNTATTKDGINAALTAALPFLQGVKVKALAWIKPPLSDTLSRCETEFGTYRTWTHSEANGKWFWSVEGGFNNKNGDGDDEVAAKAAAQADYSARILSAIDVAPSPRAQALEEAHSDLINRLNDDIAQLERMAEQAKFAGSETGVRVKSPSILLADLRDAAAAIRALSSQSVADRHKTVEELAAYLCDEFDFDLNPVHGASWPEHENDEGKREGGYVRLQPSDVQAYARENAKRILAFLGLPASPGAAE